VRDRAKPWPDTPNLLSAGERRIGAKQRLLDGLLSVPMSNQLGTVVHQRPPVANDEHLECRVVSARVGAGYQPPP
jgi:hypothetical protein